MAGRPLTLVLFCTFSERLQVFVLMTPSLFDPNFGVFRWTRSPMLISREIIFEVYYTTCVEKISERYGQTDLLRHNRASIAR